jgi:hypothetical protein
VLITGMLVFSGLGSFASERFLPTACARFHAEDLPRDLRAILVFYAFFIDYRARLRSARCPTCCGSCCALRLLAPPAFLMGFPMPTGMTTLGRLGKDHMFLWAWGVNGCFSVIGAALVPIVATSFGLPAVVLLGAFAYLIALPAFFSVLKPLPSGRSSGPRPREAARAAAVGGAPDAGRLHTRRPRSRQTKPPVKKAVRPSSRRPRRCQTGLQPLKEAKTQLISFNASAFPYIGVVPDTKKLFLDVKQGNRRGHTTLRGDVCWDDRPITTAARCSICRPATIPRCPA